MNTGDGFKLERQKQKLVSREAAEKMNYSQALPVCRLQPDLWLKNQI